MLIRRNLPWNETHGYRIFGLRVGWWGWLCWLAVGSTWAAECPNISVLISGGSFPMGKETSVFQDTAPVHQVSLADFRIFQHEVTVTEFLAFANRQKLEFPFRKLLEEEARYKPCLPARGISWHLAQGYCQSRGGRLPTEAEWEYAATVNPRANHRKSLWPSGNEFPELYDGTMLEETEDEESEVESALALPSSFLNRDLVEVPQSFLGINGLHGMMGNVWEWVHDWYGPYVSVPQTNPQGPPEGFWKVLRGGSHQNVEHPALLDPTLRNQARPEQFFAHVGFRCAWSTL